MHAQISHITSFFPSDTETLDVLVERNPSWNKDELLKKVGIQKRFISNDLSVIDMGYAAVKKQLDAGFFVSDELEFIIFVTQSPPRPLPSVSCAIHGLIKAPSTCLSFDVNQGCSGYLYALMLSESIMKTLSLKTGIVICCDKYTGYCDISSKSTRTVFSDVATCTLMRGSKEPKLLGFVFGTDGAGHDNLIVNKGKLHMNGPALMIFAMNRVPELYQSVMHKAGINKSLVTMNILHQASATVLVELKRKLLIDDSRFYIGIEHVGNTVSSTIPLAIQDISTKRGFFREDYFSLLGFGVGYSWGGCIWQPI